MKGKRELFVEVLGEQIKYPEFKKMLDENIKAAGIKYDEDVKMYFNINERTVYCVSEKGKQLQVSF